jgi:hypothetical protein
MSRRTSTVVTLAAALAVAVTGAVGAQDSLGSRQAGPEGGPEPGHCSIHANLLLKACLADRQDDFFVHKADCFYVTPPPERFACLSDARTESMEKKEECEEVYEARLDICALVGQGPFLPDFDPDEFVDPDDIGDTVDPNPYWPLTEGHTHVIVADEEVTVVTATDEVRDVGGLPCRVIRDLVFEEVEEEGAIGYEAVEVTQDWYAQHEDGDVIYCGENTYEIEDELIDNTDGSFAHETDRAVAGFLVRAFPVPGEGDRQEMATDEAEDFVEYVSLAATPSDDEGGDSENFPCTGDCLQTFEVNPHDPGEGEYKYYLPDTGFVLATKLEDGEPTGEREEVTCLGDSLDVLDDPDCDIGDPDALRDALCFWAPAALCDA